MKVGSKVTFAGGGVSMVGIVERIQPGPWTNGGRPMVRVRWESGHTSRVTDKLLEEIR